MNVARLKKSASSPVHPVRSVFVQWLPVLCLSVFAASCSASSRLDVVSYYADQGSHIDYPLAHAFDGNPQTHWMSASPTADLEGGIHQMIRIDLGRKKAFNRIDLRNWRHIDTPLRIFASDRLTDDLTPFLSYEANFYPTFSGNWRGPAISRSYELIAEIPRPIGGGENDRAIRFEFSTANNRYIYLVLEGYRSTSGVRHPRIGDIGIYYQESDVYRIPRTSAADLTPPVYDIFDFGAVGDGRTEDTKAIQAAVDACHEAGRGTVWIHNGIFASAAVRLKSNVRLHIDGTAMVLAYTGEGVYEDPEDLYRDKYPGMRQIDLYRDKESYPGFTEPEREYALNQATWLGEQKGFDGWLDHRGIFFAEHAVNVTIEGRGVIHGNHHHPIFDRDMRRSQPPYLLRFFNCKNVTVRDIIIMNAVDWSQTFTASDNVLIENVIVDNVGEFPSDGLAVLGCRHVTIRDNYIHSDDDCIVIKSIGPPKLVGPTSDILIENNVVNSLRNRGLNIGTETEGPIRNLVYRNNVITHAGKGGIGIQAVDGADVENLSYENIYIRAGVPIYMRLGNRDRYHTGKIGSMRNITFKNIYGYGYLNWGCLIAGISGHTIQNVTFSNMWLDVQGGLRDIPASPTDDKVDGYPQENMFGVLPAYGFYLRHAQDFVFDRVNIRYRSEDARDWLVKDYTSGITLIDCKEYRKELFPPAYHDIACPTGLSVTGQTHPHRTQITPQETPSVVATADQLSEGDDINRPASEIVAVLDSRHLGTERFAEHYYEPFPVDAEEHLLIENVYCGDSDIINAAVWAVRDNLRVDDRAYGDRQFLVSYLPPNLQGSTWIRPSMESKDFEGDALIRFSMKEQGTVYVAYPDYLQVEKPAWLHAWQPTEEYIMIRRGGRRTLWRFQLFKRDFKADSHVTLGSNDMPNLNEMISRIPPTGKDGFRLRAPLLYPEQYFIILQ